MKWKKVKLGEISLLNQNNISKNHKYDFVNYLDTSNLTTGTIQTLQKLYIKKDKIPSRAKRLVKYHDILISTVRPNQKHYGIIKENIENLIVSTGFAVLTARTDICYPNFLYYFLTQDYITEYLHSIAESSTTTYPSIKPNVISNLTIPLPPLPVQKKIAKILSSLDDKIELNNRMNQTLEEIAQTLFKHWFIDFEFPDENGKPYKTSGGEMKPSPLGPIPKTWEVGKLGDICKCLLGGTPSRNKLEYWNGNIPWINSGKINEFRIIKPSEFITEIGLKKSATKLLPKKTTVIAITGATLGQVSLTEIETCANQSVIGILENLKLPYTYIYPFFKNKIFDLINNQTGGAQQHINKNDVETTNILIPNEKFMMAYHSNAKCLYEFIANNALDIETLTKLRDNLLPKLMSGEIDLETTEKEIQEKFEND